MMSAAQRAEQFLADGELAKAQQAFVALGSQSPAQAQMGLGQVAWHRHQFWRAERHFWNAARQQADGAVVRAWIAACRLGRGDIPGALELAQQAQSRGGKDAWTAWCLGRALAADGQLAAAWQVVREAMETFGDDLRLQLLFIRLQFDMGQRAEQLEAVAALMQTHPADESVWALGATLLVEAGDVATAQKVLKTGVSADPTRVTLQFLYAELLLRTGQHEALTERLEFLEAVAGGSAEWLLELGSLYAELGDAEAAVGKFAEALQAEPEHPEALYRIGGYAAASGNADAARDFFARAKAGGHPGPAGG